MDNKKLIKIQEERLTEIENKLKSQGLKVWRLGNDKLRIEYEEEIISSPSTWVHLSGRVIAATPQKRTIALLHRDYIDKETEKILQSIFIIMKDEKRVIEYDVSHNKGMHRHVYVMGKRIEIPGKYNLDSVIEDCLLVLKGKILDT